MNKILLILMLAPFFNLYAQQDSIDLNKLIRTQEQWEAVRDYYAVEAIKMLARIDTINIYIDSLKQVSAMIDSYDCEKELYMIVGASKEEVNGYRLKFDETEKRVNSKSGTPSDAHRLYFDEVNNSKIKCLPEFYERFLSLKKKIEEWEGGSVYSVETPEGSYLVVKGDCLWSISEKKYQTPYLWPAIWDANLVSIVNPEAFDDIYYHNIFNPNYIYPGQVLKIPSLSEKERKDAEERSKYFRRFRKRQD